jgi:hypothetical protein
LTAIGAILEELLREHDRIGSAARSRVGAPIRAGAAVQRLREADLPVIEEYVELVGWHDGLLGGPGIFGDTGLGPLDRNVDLTLRMREGSQVWAQETGGDVPPDVDWPRDWLVVGGGERHLCVLDATRRPATVLHVFKHGEDSARTIARSLSSYVEQSVALFRGDAVALDLVTGQVGPSETAVAGAAMAEATRPPRWLLAGAMPEPYEVRIDRRGTQPASPGSASIHRVVPERALRVEPRTATYAWHGRAPVAFLEVLPPIVCSVGELAELVCLLTDGTGAPIADQPIDLRLSGAVHADLQARTDANGIATCAYEPSVAGQFVLRCAADLGNTPVYGSSLAQLGLTIGRRSQPAVGLGISLGREASTASRLVRVRASQLPDEWSVLYRHAPAQWIEAASGFSAGRGATIADIDERELWPGTSYVQVVDTGREPIRRAIEPFQADGGRVAALLARIEPSLAAAERTWSRLVIVPDHAGGFVLGPTEDPTDWQEVGPEQVLTLGHAAVSGA